MKKPGIGYLGFTCNDTKTNKKVTSDKSVIISFHNPKRNPSHTNKKHCNMNGSIGQPLL